MNYKVPFYPNSPDDMRCVSAVFGMILNYFTHRKYSWRELDDLTGHRSKKGTWFFPVLTKLKKKGFEIEVIDTFDYKKCYEEREKYLRKYFKNPQALKFCLERTDLFDKIELLPEFIKTIKPKKKSPDIKDIGNFLKKGYLIAVELDMGVLNNRDSYISHLILIIGFDKDNFIFHDPGLPPIKNRKVSKEIFEKAWSYDGESSHNITAIKYNNQ